MSESHVTVNFGVTPPELKKTLVNIVNVVKLANSFMKNPQVTKVLEMVDVAINNENFISLVADIITFFEKNPATKEILKDLMKDFSK